MFCWPRSATDRYGGGKLRFRPTGHGRFLPVARGMSRPDAHQGQEAVATFSVVKSAMMRSTSTSAAGHTHDLTPKSWKMKHG
jgi:hypothetical protein